MKDIIAYCGIRCNECPVYKATIKNDVTEKERISESWSTEKYPLKPADVECYGCSNTDKKVISFCKGCDIRECGIYKNVENCGFCTEYPCDKLSKVFKKSPESKMILDEIHGKEKK